MTTSSIGSAYLFGPQAAAAGEIVTREDVLDLVINIDPYDSPFVTMAPKVSAASTLHEWIQDTLDATATASGDQTATTTALMAWTEGADYAARDLVNRSRITNVTQIFRKDIKVSNTMRALNPFGVADEYSYQILKATREIARNMEVAAFRQGASGGSSGTSAAGRFWKSLEGFLTTNAAFARGTMLSNSGADQTATAYPVRESDFNAMLDRIYQQGGNPDTAYISPSVKRYVSQWGAALFPTITADVNAGARELQAFSNPAEKRLVRAINVYESDFGLIQMVLDRWVPQATANAVTGTATGGRLFVLERTRNRLAFLRPVRHVPLPPGGDNTRGIVVGEATLEVLAEKGSGLIKLVSPRGN